MRSPFPKARRLWSPRTARSLAAVLAFGLLALAWWKVEFIDAPHRAKVLPETGDLYAYMVPMLDYGFGVLREGRLPLWNPYQLCGFPFLATIQTAVLYPPNLLYLVFDPSVGVEIALVLHLALAGFGAAALARAVGASRLGALAAGLSFMWSGPMAWLTENPSIQLGFCWMPVTLLCVERVVRGAAWAGIGLALVTALQLLAGQPQPVVYNMLAAGTFACFRLGSLAATGGSGPALRRAGLLVGALLVGALLAAPQLVPALELALLSERAPGSLDTSRLVSPSAFTVFDHALLSGVNPLGTLPLLALALGVGSRRLRNPYLFCVVSGLAALLLAAGGPLYGWWFATPLGGLFRGSARFLTVLSLAAALLAAISVTRLEDWLALPRRALWLRPDWLAGLALVTGSLAWLGVQGLGPVWLVALLVLLLLFGAATDARLRRAALVGIVLCQAAQLFTAPEKRSLRPVARPEVFAAQASLLEELRREAGFQRIFLSRRLVFEPGLTLKQGVLSQLYTVSDYDSLTPARHGEVFRRLAGAPSGWRARGLTGGMLELGEDAHWPWLDLMSVRFFVVTLGTDEAAQLIGQSRTPGRGVRAASLEHRPPPNLAVVFERVDPLPRAYFVSRAQVVGDPDAALAAVEDPAFDPRAEVVLELSPDAPAPAAGGDARGAVEIESLAPERVVLGVEASGPGLVVLTDSFYPGWQVRGEEGPLPIHRANYLFRAVAVPAGRTRLVFEYRPASVRIGFALGGAAVLVLVAAAFARRQR